jgi:hypothetical protein
VRDPKKWKPVFGKDHAQSKERHQRLRAINKLELVQVFFNAGGAARRA